jgi:hypothetical protein
MRFTRFRSLELALAALLMLCLVTVAGATECVKQYTWSCGIGGGICKGAFTPNAETFTETDTTFPYTGPFELYWVLRYGNLPKGTHKLRTSFEAQDVVVGNPTGEILEVKKKQLNGCTESTPGFDMFQSFQDEWLGYWSGLTLADYDLGLSGKNDICLSFRSLQQPPDPGFTGHEEFIMDGDTDPSEQVPAIVTTLDTNYTCDSEQTSPGIIFSGNCGNTHVCDNIREVLQEGGTNHRLFHVYEITDIPVGSSQTLKVEGYRSNNTDGDNFAILYKWSSTACSTSGMYLPTGIAIDSAAEVNQSTTIGNSSGRLCVAVDDTAGGSVNDKVNIDCIYVETANPVCP